MQEMKNARVNHEGSPTSRNSLSCEGFVEDVGLKQQCEACSWESNSDFRAKAEPKGL